MIPSQTISALIFTIAVSIIIPIILLVYSKRKLNGSFLAFFAGAFIYLIFQVIFRMSLIDFLSSSLGLSWAESSFLFLALTAAIFEVFGRFFGYKLLMKNKLHPKDGLIFGSGYITVEMVLFSAFTSINYLIMSLAQNGVAFIGMLNRFSDTEIAAFNDLLVNTPSGEFLAMGIERILTLPIQLAITLMLVYSVISKKSIWFVASLLIHFFATFLSLWAGSFGVWWNILVLIPFTAAGIYIIYYYFSKIYPESIREKKTK